MVQDLSNSQSLNRYTYVLNNPLSMTDPTGFFFGSIFKAIGNFISKIFNAIASAFKAILKIPLIRAAIQIIGCGISGPAGVAVCAGVTGVLSLLSGGSIGDALQAMAFTVASAGVWTGVGAVLEPLKELGTAAFTAIKSAVHGVVGGALSMAQGGSFMDGFVANAAGAAAGVMSEGVFGPPRTGGVQGFFGRTAAAAIAGGTASVLTGGKFANAAITAAFAQMWNSEDLLNGIPGANDPPLGTVIAPFGEKLVPYDMLPAGSRQILQYRKFFYDELTQSWWVGFHGPVAGMQLVPTFSRSGVENGFAVAPLGSPPIEPGKEPASGIRVGFANEKTGLPYMRVFNSLRQPISPVTGRPVPPQSNEAHYPLSPTRPFTVNP